MWKLNKGKDFLKDVSLSRLQRHYEKERAGKVKLRLLAAIKRKRGESLDAIAEEMEQPRRTIHGWLHRFEERGIAAAHSKKQTGRPKKLTAAQQEELTKRLEKGPKYNPSGLWTTKEVREIIEKKYGVSYVHQHVWRLLVAAGFSIQRPRKRHHKAASPREIALFKKKLGRRPNIIAKKDLS